MAEPIKIEWKKKEDMSKELEEILAPYGGMTDREKYIIVRYVNQSLLSKILTALVDKWKPYTVDGDRSLDDVFKR